MRGIMKTPALICLVVFSLAMLACSSDETPSGYSSELRATVVVGEVLMIDDQVPVDGGVTIDIEVRRGETERLLFGSLFTNPPPPRERLELYRVIVELEIGDRVRARGSRSEHGIILEDLFILDD